MPLIEHITAPDAHTLFVTGAGISVASGIPTFRGSDPDAIWAKDVLEMGTRRYFDSEPVHQWQWYLSRFDGCRGAEPNPAHTALAGIQQKLETTLVTQNIDGLHLRAGSPDVVEIHGAARKMRCRAFDCPNGAPKGFLDWDDALFQAFRDNPCSDTLPRCPHCNDIIRAHVLWFDENYEGHEDYGLSRLQEIQGKFTNVVFIGTSFSVGITDMISTLAIAFDVPAFVIDPHMTEPPDPHMHLIQEASEVYLPRLLSRIS